MDNSENTQNSSLYNRRVALIGDYTIQQEKQLRYELAKRGALMVPKENGKYKISRTTHYCIVFDNPSEEDLFQIKDFSFDGYHITKVPFNDLAVFLSDDIKEYFTKEKVVRNLRLNPEYLTYDRFKVKDKTKGVNPFARQEFYLGGGLSGDRDLLCQIIGNLGGYANREIFNDTQILLLSDVSVKNILQGQTDETIQYIQNTYNSKDDALGFFNYKIISESDYLDRIKRWCDNVGNQITLDLYRQYKRQ